MLRHVKLRAYSKGSSPWNLVRPGSSVRVRRGHAGRLGRGQLGLGRGQLSLGRGLFGLEIPCAECVPLRGLEPGSSVGLCSTLIGQLGHACGMVVKQPGCHGCVCYVCAGKAASSGQGPGRPGRAAYLAVGARRRPRCVGWASSSCGREVRRQPARARRSGRPGRAGYLAAGACGVQPGCASAG